MKITLDFREGIKYLKYIRGNQPHGDAKNTINEMFPLGEVYEVKNGEMFGSFSHLGAGDLQTWQEEGRYPELFALLNRGTNRIRETKESETADAEWFDATGM